MTELKEFLLAEYEHIADPHFETGKQVSTYFNYCLLILAAPVIIVSLIQNKNIDEIVSGAGASNNILHWIVTIILLMIALVGGLCVG